MWLQFALMAAIAVTAARGPRWRGARGPRLGAGAALGAAGGALGAWSARSLGRSLTPLPAPAQRGDLVQTGPYALARHPIYGAGLLVLGGLSLATSPRALGLTGALAATWSMKSRVEERFLEQRYPEFPAYRARVRARFLPYAW